MTDEEKAALVRRVELRLHSKRHQLVGGREMWPLETILTVLEEEVK